MTLGPELSEVEGRSIVRERGGMDGEEGRKRDRREKASKGR